MLVTTLIENYDKLALAKPLLAKSVVSLTTYASAECFRQAMTTTTSRTIPSRRSGTNGGIRRKLWGRSGNNRIRISDELPGLRLSFSSIPPQALEHDDLDQIEVDFGNMKKAFDNGYDNPAAANGNMNQSTTSGRQQVVSSAHGNVPTTTSSTGSTSLRNGLNGIIFMALVGFMIHAPWINFWFGLLEKLAPGKTMQSITTKIITDQLIGCPIYYVLIMYITSLADGKSMKTASKNIKNGMWPTVRKSWMAWPLLHLINFTFVPIHRRPLLLQFGGLLWAIFLCTLTAASNNQQQQQSLSPTMVATKA